MLTPIYFIAVLVAYAVKGMSGFANTLVLSTILSFTTNNLNISPLDLILSMPSNALIAWKDRKKLNFRVCVPMAICAVLGSIPGVYLLKRVDASVLKIVMGLLIAGIGVETWLRGRAKGAMKQNTAVMIVVSLLSGTISGIFGIGALMAAYVNRCSDSNGEFRANICFVFLAENVFRLILYIATEIMTMRIFLNALCFMPCMFIGLFLGMRAVARIGEKNARTVTSAMLVLSGVSVVITNLANVL